MKLIWKKNRFIWAYQCFVSLSWRIDDVPVCMEGCRGRDKKRVIDLNLLREEMSRIECFRKKTLWNQPAVNVIMKFWKLLSSFFCLFLSILYLIFLFLILSSYFSNAFFFVSILHVYFSLSLPLYLSLFPPLSFRYFTFSIFSSSISPSFSSYEHLFFFLSFFLSPLNCT